MRAAGARYTPRGRQLGRVTLTVIDRESVATEALLARDGEGRGRIEPSGQQYDGGGFLHGGATSLARRPRGTCAAVSGSVPAVAPRGSSRRDHGRGAVRGSGGTDPRNRRR